MASQALTLQGLSNFQRLLSNLVPDVRREVKAITEATGQAITAEAKANVPVDTGDLKASIRFEVINNGFGVEMSVGMPYWAYVEFGTGGLVSIPDGFDRLAGQFKGKGIRQINRAAQPFLIPAWLKYQDMYFQAVRDVLPRLLR